jgi:hydrogenase maturation protein HypF
MPLQLPAENGPILAAGGEKKNTFCLTRGKEAFISQHIGDLKNADTLLGFERTEALFERLFRIRPATLVSDSHPDYLTTSYCLERDRTSLKLQHHKAHIAACLAENGFTEPAIGVALDGTGFGDDGAIWGGEFLVGGLQDGFTRAAHFEYVPLLGGESAIREPWRMALAATWEYAPDDIEFVAERLGVSSQKLGLLVRQLEAGLNCPPTSSCGRLFDAVGALVLGRLTVSYEAQAAIELEAAAGRCTGATIFGPDGLFERREFSEAESAGGNTVFPGAADEPGARLGSVSYRFALDRSTTPWIISPARAIKRILSNLELGERPEIISRRFHLGLAESIVRTCLGLAELNGLETVALSGGVFQNRLLLMLVRDGLAREGLKPLMHRQVPANDGGISYGQAAIACMKNNKPCA